MSPRRVRAESDAVERRERPLRITVDGEPVDGIAGQTIAGVLLAADRVAWRRGRSGAPRGVFCGIGVCFDCLVTVGGERDVRACRRRAREGDVVRTQSREPGAGETAVREGAEAVPGSAESAEGAAAPMPGAVESPSDDDGSGLPEPESVPGPGDATSDVAGSAPRAAEPPSDAAGTASTEPESVPGTADATSDVAGPPSPEPESVPGTADATSDVAGSAPRAAESPSDADDSASDAAGPATRSPARGMSVPETEDR